MAYYSTHGISQFLLNNEKQRVRFLLAHPVKLASCHLLLYVVYTCQKSFNFINAFACYKQKYKLAPFNLAHPVYYL